MPARTYKAFVSSTYEDLKEHRRHVIKALRGAGFHVDPMEEWTSAADEPKELSRERVDGCDLCVLLVAMRRGHVPAGETRSITQIEVERAEELGIDVLAFVLDPEAPWWPQFRDEADEELHRWRAELREHRTAPFFDLRPESIEVAPALSRWLQKRSAESPPAEAEEGPRILTVRRWRPEPQREPYPLLRPYTDPSHFAGRERELEELRRLLARRVSIVGVFAASGAGKSSLLRSGLLPAEAGAEGEVAGRPVAYADFPHEPGVAEKLAGDLVEGGAKELARAERRFDAEGDPAAFAELVEGFAGMVDALAAQGAAAPLLVLDQFEEVLRLDGGHPARAKAGALLAATARPRPGASASPCQWVLGYRHELHGAALLWLGDALRDARRAGLPGTGGLPSDLSPTSRFEPFPLEPFATAPSGDSQATASRRAFLAAIERPLELVEAEGQPRYPWRFRSGDAGRLADAFAAARRDQPDAPLLPELQVVLARQIAEAGERESSELRVPEEPGELIARALDHHLRDTLERSFPRATPRFRERRARALLALRELATAAGKRGEGLSTERLLAILDPGGRELLDDLQSARLIVAHPEGDRYLLSHDRLAEVVVRAVDEERALLDLGLDDKLLGVRRLVDLQSALHERGSPGEREQASRLSWGSYLRIARHREALLVDDRRREWWAACRRRARRSATRWAAAALAVATLAAAGIGIAASRDSFLRRVQASNPEESATALIAGHRWVSNEEIEEALVQRGTVDDLFGPALSLERTEERAAAVAAIVEPARPLLLGEPAPYRILGTALWALDYASSTAPREIRHRLGALRRALLERFGEPPAIGKDDFVEIDPRGASAAACGGPAEGAFCMGSNEPEASGVEQPVHPVRLSPFRMQVHEVTRGELERFRAAAEGRRATTPSGGGDERLPAVEVTWWEAYTYAAWLDGRLPTEAEWEYAAKSGCAAPEGWCSRNETGEVVKVPLGHLAWYGANSNAELHPVVERGPGGVPLKRPNQHGLYDIYGNAWEWVGDWYDSRTYDDRLEAGASGVVDDPWGAPRGENRVIRGGSFIDDAWNARATYRLGWNPWSVGGDQGFRVRLPGPEPDGE